MPLRPRPVKYREAMAALTYAHQIVQRLLKSGQLYRATRRELELLREYLAALINRDDGRSR